MSEQQAQLPPVGKISPDIFDQIIKPRLGRHRPEILVGPRHGVDVGIIDLGGGRVMAVTTDPFFVVPAYGWERAGWFAVHILASDAVTSGLPPTYLTVDLNLPRAITREQFDELWQAVDAACHDIGLAIVAGHTGRYDGTDYPMVGGATVFAIGDKDRYLTPEMAQVGDAVIVTKGAAIEATGLFGVTFPARIADAVGPDIARAAEDLFYQMSVVKDGITAVSVGVRDKGVTTLHDATEGGVWGGLYEVAQVSRVGMVVEQDAIIVRPEVRAVCDLFGMDPYSAISEGSLVITCRPAQAGEVITRLENEGIAATRVGEITPRDEGIRIVERGRERPLEHPRVDPFWEAFGRALGEA